MLGRRDARGTSSRPDTIRGVSGDGVDSGRKETLMQQVRVAVYTLKPGTADEVIRRAETDLVGRFRNEVGFVAYGLVKTGDDAVISLSIWDLADQATAAVQIAAGWEQESLGGMVDAVENHLGSLAFFWALVAIGR